MAFEGISDSQMYDEVMEVVGRLSLKDKDIDFLDNIAEWAERNDLSPARRKWLEDIYRKACDLDEGHHD